MKYLDLETDYMLAKEKILESVKEAFYFEMKEAIKYGYGIRILIKMFLKQ